MGNGTPLGQVRGLGSSHHGVHHWLVQRFTAIGNLVLLLFLAISFAMLPGYDFETVRAWVASPLPAVALALMIISVFWHARLGLQVLAEDYVHTAANRFGVLALLSIATFGGAAFGLFCIVRLALGGAA